MNKTFKMVVLALIILIIIIVVWVLFLKIKYSDAKVTFCEVDSDCVIVSVGSCCNVKAVNLAYQDYFVNKVKISQCYCKPSSFLPECYKNNCQIKSSFP